jgi:hypothetical protein
MIPEIIKETENVFSGITEVIFKGIKGIILAFSFLIFSRFLDVVFGIYWLSNQNIFLIGIILFSFYSIFINYKKFNYYYLLGWIVGISIMLILNIITPSKALRYIVIPIIVLIIRKLFFP